MGINCELLIVFFKIQFEVFGVRLGQPEQLDFSIVLTESHESSPSILQNHHGTKGQSNSRHETRHGETGGSSHNETVAPTRHGDSKTLNVV